MTYIWTLHNFPSVLKSALCCHSSRPQLYQPPSLSTSLKDWFFFKENLPWIIEKERTDTSDFLQKMSFQNLVYLMSFFKIHIKLFSGYNGILEESNKQWNNGSECITGMSFLTDFLLSLDLTILAFYEQITCELHKLQRWKQRKEINYISQRIS